MTISSALKQDQQDLKELSLQLQTCLLKLMSKIWPIMMLCIKTH